jgi:apolipoprotein N-acyltransferase
MNFFKTHPRFKEFFVTFSSSVLLVLAFPRYNFFAFAWFSFVALFLLLDNVSRGKAFRIAYLSGFIFFFSTLYWFLHVTSIGTVLLVAYLSLYFGLFGLAYHFFSKEKLLLKALAIPSAWVALEYMRSNFLSGFGWASLAYSQYHNLPMIQIADVTGQYGVSFVVMLINVLLKEMYGSFRQFILVEQKQVPAQRQSILKSLLIQCVVTVSVLAGVWFYGNLRLKETSFDDTMKVTVIQPNIAQEMKWEEFFWPFILQEHMDLTREALAQPSDLIVWPETSFPGFVGEKEELLPALTAFVASVGKPFVFGAIENQDEQYYNSSFFVSAQGRIVETYHKLHLVPFGEFLPLRKVLPFLEDLVPIEDFTSGKDFVLFPLSFVKKSLAEYKAAVLICFEDTVPQLSREFVRRGANVLVNVTNDAWFGDTKAPFMHLQASVFRTIENRRFLIRSANTGVSCFIAPSGRIYEGVRNEDGKAAYVRGFASADVGLKTQKTFYTKFGDIFTYLCFACILGTIYIRKKIKTHC